MANLTAGSATVTISGGARTSVAAYSAANDTDPKKMQAHSFSPTFGASTTVTLTLASGATVAACGSLDVDKVFYRVWGNSTDVAHGAAAATSDDVAIKGVVNTSIGTIS